MSKCAQVSWRVLLDDTDWNSDATLSPPPATEGAGPTSAAHPRRAWWLTVAVALLLAAVAGLYFRRQAQIGLAQVESDIAARVDLGVQARQTGDDLKTDALLDRQADPEWRQRILADIRPGGPVETEILSLDLQGDLAMVRLLVTDPALPQPYRETQFYRETTGGWMRTQPEPAFWGRQEALESEHFVFHYRILDRAAVAEASLILDERYARSRALLGLPPSWATKPEAKVQVFVYARGYLDVESPVQVDSPWQRTLPASMTDAGFLVEAVDLELRQRLVFESRAAAPHQGNSRLPAAGLLDGLRLWLVWQNGGLLADHKAELVHWLYMEAPDGPGQHPDSHGEICQTLGGLALRPQDLSVPFLCSGPNAPLPSVFDPPARLGQLPLAVGLTSVAEYGTGTVYEPIGATQAQGTGLAMATVLEYVTRTYGPDAVPRLLDAAAAGKSWPTVAPDLFGATLEEFQAGWLDYLGEAYEVDLEKSRQ